MTTKQNSLTTKISQIFRKSLGELLENFQQTVSDSDLNKHLTILVPHFLQACLSKRAKIAELEAQKRLFEDQYGFGWTSLNKPIKLRVCS